MNLFKFLAAVRWDMLLSDAQYGRLQLIELTTGHSDQSGNQRREAGYYTVGEQRHEKL
jgi:hypothetical protein